MINAINGVVLTNDQLCQFVEKHAQTSGIYTLSNDIAPQLISAVTKVPENEDTKEIMNYFANNYAPRQVPPPPIYHNNQSIDWDSIHQIIPTDNRNIEILYSDDMFSSDEYEISDDWDSIHQTTPTDYRDAEILYSDDYEISDEKEYSPTN
jgi:hypothetical protein